MKNNKQKSIIKKIIDKGIKETKKKCYDNVNKQIKEMRKYMYKKYGIK